MSRKAWIKIKILLYDTKNIEYIFDNILNFEVISNLESPAKELFIKFKTSSPLKTFFYKIKLFVNNNLIFEGLIDEQILSKSNSNIINKIIARSKACLLLDTIAQPQTYNNISLKNILDNHIANFGFSYKKISSCILETTLESFTILPKMSEWDVLKSFLDKSLGLFAFVSDKNEILVSDNFKNSNISISNNINNNLVCFNKNYNFSNISVCFDKKSKLNSKFNNILSIKIYLSDLFLSSIGKKIFVFDEILSSLSLDSLFIIKKLCYIFKNNEFYSYLVLFPNFKI